MLNLAGMPPYRNRSRYYDHGDSQAEENVAAIHGFYGSEVSKATDPHQSFTITHNTRFVRC